MKESTDWDSCHIGQAIERIRRLRDMTQTELGQIVGISKQTISKIEHSACIGPARLQQIAHALGITPGQLIQCGKKRALLSQRRGYSIPRSFSHDSMTGLPIEELIDFFERILQKDRERLEKLKKERQKIF